MNELQQIVKRAIADLFKPETMLARLVAAKLVEQGIESAAEHLPAIEAAMKAKLDDPTHADWSAFSIETRESGLDVDGVEVRLVGDDLDKSLAELSAAVEKAVPPLVEKLARGLLTNIKRAARAGLNAHDVQRIEFERRLHSRWAKPLDLMALEIELVVEIGRQTNHWLRRRVPAKRRHLIDVMTRLHARACHIAAEILALLRSGFADGALARWRTLYEVLVVSSFILENGEEVAERYVCHLNIASFDAARNYQRFAPALGYHIIPAKQLDAVQRRKDEMVKRFGKDFKNEYGWAAAATGNSDPKFDTIEAAANLSRLRPYYKLASGNVHAGPKAAFFRVGLLPGAEQVLLAGPSNSGLDEAGRLAAMTLAQVTAALLLVRPTIDSAVQTMILFRLADDVEIAFNAVQRRLAKEEKGRPKETSVRQ